MNELYLELEDHFDRFGWTWKMKDQSFQQPDRYDFEKALDLAAEKLYTEEVGAILEIGRLVIIKQVNGLDVYVLAGTVESNQGEK